MSNLNYRPDIKHEVDRIYEDDQGNPLVPPQDVEAQRVDVANEELEAEILRDMELIESYNELCDITDEVVNTLWDQMKFLDKAIPPVDPSSFPNLHMNLRALMAQAGNRGLPFSDPGAKAVIPITRDLMKLAEQVNEAGATMLATGSDIRKVASNVSGAGNGNVDANKIQENADKTFAEICKQIFIVAFCKMIAKLLFFVSDTLKPLEFIGLGFLISPVRKLCTDTGNELAAKTINVDVNGMIEGLPEQEEDGNIQDEYGRNITSEQARFDGTVPPNEQYTQAEVDARKQTAVNMVNQRGNNYLGGWGQITSSQGGVNVNMFPGAQGLRNRIEGWGAGAPESGGEPAPRHGPQTWRVATMFRQNLRRSGGVIDICCRQEAINRWKAANPGKEIPKEINDNPFTSYDHATGQPLGKGEEGQRWADFLLQAGITYPDFGGELKEQYRGWIRAMRTSLVNLMNIVISWAEDPATLCCLIEWIKRWAALSTPDNPFSSITDILRWLRMLVKILNTESALKLSSISNILNDMVKDILNALGMVFSLAIRNVFNQAIDWLRKQATAGLAGINAWADDPNHPERGGAKCLPAQQFFEWIIGVIDMIFRRLENLVSDFLGSLSLTFGNLPDYNLALQTKIQAEKMLWILEQLIALLTSLDACIQGPEGVPVNNPRAQASTTASQTGTTQGRAPGLDQSLDVIDNMRRQRLDTLTDIFGTAERAQEEYLALYGHGRNKTGQNLGNPIFGWIPDSAPCAGAPTEENLSRISEMLGVHLNRPNE